METPTTEPLSLGIDIGTTSVKLSLVGNSGSQVINGSVSLSSNAVMPSVSVPQDGCEQSIWLIFQTIENCLKKIGRELLCRVTKIGVTGQMHGVVLWKSKAVSLSEGGLELKSTDVSPLFNWQDGRCSPGFLASLPRPKSHLRLATGHGCATMFWWLKNHPGYLDQFDYAGTVMDLFVSVLCGTDCPVMSNQNAASWGYFDCESATWNKEILSSAQFPVRLLPEVLLPGSCAGSLKVSWLGLSEGTQIGVAMGDLPCAIYSVLTTPTDAVLNMGTSAQLVRSMPDDFTPTQSPDPSSVEYFAYFSKRYIAVAAALNGGNVLSTFVDVLMQWCSSLVGTGVSTDRNEIFRKLIDLASNAETDLIVDPVLLGERHRQSDRGSISNLQLTNTDLGGFFRAICRGVITNLESMMTKGDLVAAGVKRIVGCGSTLSQNRVLKEELERCFDLPVVYRDESDACLGAALYVQSIQW